MFSNNEHKNHKEDKRVLCENLLFRRQKLTIINNGKLDLLY